MDRKLLHDVLTKLAPALKPEAGDQLPVYASFCFDAQAAHAWDEVIALRRPYDKDFNPSVRGAIRGKPLLDFLASSKAHMVEFEPHGETVMVRAGRIPAGTKKFKASSRMETGLLPESAFVFETPEVSGATRLRADEATLAALGYAAGTMMRDASKGVPWQYGVTVAVEKSRIEFYSADEKSTVLSRAVVEGANKLHGGTHLLLPRFVELLLSLAKGDPLKGILLAPEWAQATFTSGLTLFSVAGAEPKLAKYRAMFEHYEEGTQVDIPAGFADCVKRAANLLGYFGETIPFTRLQLKDKVMKLETRTPAADVFDKLRCGHPDTSLDFHPGLLHRCLDAKVLQLSLFPDAIRLTGENRTRLISAVTWSRAESETEGKAEEAEAELVGAAEE